MSNVRTIRERLKLTQAELAAVIGCTQGNVGHYERGQTVPPAVARRLIRAARERGLDLSFDDVYGPVEGDEPEES
jgi:putative transcriptional regulator